MHHIKEGNIQIQRNSNPNIIVDEKARHELYPMSSYIYCPSV